MSEYRPIHAPRGTKLSCLGWQTEAPFRMIQNNLDPEVAEDPENLVVYGGSGKAARSWESYHAILRTLKTLKLDETMLVQSGKPVGVFRTHAYAPRVLIANSLLVPKWATWEHFRDLEDRGLMMFGQMTAGSWIYIGTQGILQGTYETFAEAARIHFGGTAKGRLLVTAGLGGMGGAQPLAATFAGYTSLSAEVDRDRIVRRIDHQYLDEMVDGIDAAIDRALTAKEKGQAVSIGVHANVVDLLARLLERGVNPDFLTDQTSAHDALNGYVPHGISHEEALDLRAADPAEYQRRAMASMAEHVRLNLKLMERGVICCDYGNNLRGQALEAGVENAFDYPGFVPAYVRPLFCEGRGPFRWVALSGDPEDIYKTDEAVLRLFPDDEVLCTWIKMAREKVKFQGLPSRICWLGYGQRARFGRELNDMVARGDLRAPVVIGRDHLDCGSVASPNRETEAMKDGTDAVADWPVLNGLLNTASGATWVSVHHGGGVGIGYAIHAGLVICADGTKEMEERLDRVLTCDPGMGVIRHADAGYEKAIDFAKERGVRVPMLEG